VDWWRAYRLAAPKKCRSSVSDVNLHCSPHYCIAGRNLA